MKDVWDLVTSPNFWTVVGGIAAVLALLAYAPGIIRTMLRRIHSRMIDGEREFYRKASVEHSKELSGPSKANQYLLDVREGIEGLGKLSSAEFAKARDDVRELIRELRKTHQTLAEALSTFGTVDAERFFADLESSRNKVSALYNHGDIPAELRTLCTRIVELTWKMREVLPEGTAGRRSMEQLGDSVVVMDREVIVPVMISILERACNEIELIILSVREGNYKRAIWIKERYWFEVQPLYRSIKDTLVKMDELLNRLDGRTTQGLNRTDTAPSRGPAG